MKTLLETRRMQISLMWRGKTTLNTYPLLITRIGFLKTVSVGSYHQTYQHRKQYTIPEHTECKLCEYFGKESRYESPLSHMYTRPKS